MGRHLLRALRERFPNAELIPSGFDVADAGAVGDGVAEARPDALVHLAGVAAPGDARRDPDRAWRVNLHGSLHVAQAVRRAAPGCTLLFASSADAYGASFRPGGAVDESVALAPLNTYAATKAAADLALGAMAAEGLRAIRLRPFNHTGPGQSEAFVVPAFARQAALVAAGLQEPVLQVGALEPQRDFLDVRDVCAAYASALAHADSLEPGTILNLASGTPRRIGDILRELLDLAGVEAEVRTDAARLRPSEIPVAAGDAGRARRLLDWAPRIPWTQTLADVLADWRERVGAGRLSEPG